jgi:hypothetical protein
MGRVAKQCSCGSGKAWSPQYDARGIFLTYTCEDCHEAKMAEYRPDVLLIRRTGLTSRLKRIEPDCPAASAGAFLVSVSLLRQLDCFPVACDQLVETGMTAAYLLRLGGRQRG